MFLFQESGNGKCQCPAGFRGDGVKKCEGILRVTLSHFIRILKGKLIRGCSLEPPASSLFHFCLYHTLMLSVKAGRKPSLKKNLSVVSEILSSMAHVMLQYK